jgi:hypothetical protein
VRERERERDRKTRARSMRSRATLEPLAEEPGGGEEDAARRRSGFHAALHRFARLVSGGADSRPAADLRVLLSVLACPLSPVPLLPRLPRNVSVLARAPYVDHPSVPSFAFA